MPTKSMVTLSPGFTRNIAGEKANWLASIKKYLLAGERTLPGCSAARISAPTAIPIINN